MSDAARWRVVVTGGASGLGRETARQLARQGADLVLVGRDRARLEETRTTIEREVRREAVRIVGTRDLAELSEVHRVAEELIRDHPSVNVLLNNAGALFARRTLTPDGLERTFALNVLAPFVLSCRLAPTLARNRPARIVSVASAAHRMQHLDLDDLQLLRGYSGYRAYGRSKLALILLTREFARRLGGVGISTFAVHPGFVRTRFGQNNPGAYGSGFRWATRLFAVSVRRGARRPAQAVSDPTLEGRSGSYLARGAVRPGSDASRDLATARRLFEICTALSGLPPSSVPPALPSEPPVGPSPAS